MDQYKQGGKGADRQFWLSAWSNTYASVDRKGKAEPIVITRPFASVFGSIQPAVLSEISGGREDGLLDRFLFAYPEPTPSRWSDDEISDEAVCSYRALYGALRDLHMPEGDHGDPEPQRVYLSTEAKEVMVHAINNHREEMEAAGFPARLRGAWSKLEAYLARLTLILLLCRSRAADRVETQDVLSALALLDYFKNHARRVYVGLYGNDPLDLLAADVEKFLKARGGYFKDEPSVLYEKLESRVKPLQAAQLTKDLKDITDSSSRLSLDTGHFRKDGQSRRYVELSLENSVNSVNGVNGVKDAGVDDVQQASSSDEGVDHSESIEEDTGEVGERGSDNLTSSSVASSVPSGNITEHDASRNGSRPIPDDPPPTRLQPEEIDNLLGPEWVGE
jgi:hypothetical protein